MGSSSDYSSEGPVKDPIQVVQELIRITLRTQLEKIVKRIQSFETIIREDTVVMNIKQWVLTKAGFNRKREIPVSILEW